MRNKRIFLIVGLVAAIVLSVLLWPREDVPFDFLKGFRRDRVITSSFSRTTIYQSEGELESFLRIAGKELTSKGWTRTGKTPKAGESWANSLNNWVLLNSSEVKYRKVRGEVQPIGFWEPGKLSVQIGERMRGRTLWQEILRKLGFR